MTFLLRTIFIRNLEETQRHTRENPIATKTCRSDTMDEERSFSLPVRDGGLNIVHPEDRVEELNWSRKWQHV